MSRAPCTPRLLFFVCLTLLTGACSRLPGTPPTVTARAATPTPTVATTTLPASITPTRLADRPCPVPPGSPAPPDMSDPAALPARLLDFVNTGGSLTALEDHLRSASLLPLPGPAVAEADLTGDGWSDLVLSIVRPAAESGPAGGGLLLFVCSDSRYILAGSTASGPGEGAPNIHASQDLNADGTADLVVGFPTCGAHTCFERVQALMWTGDGLENRLQGDSGDLPYPALLLTGPTEDGTFRIEITGTAIASVGAGPYRPLTRTWVWDAAQAAFVVAGEFMHTTNYRIHVLQDADRAAAQGDYAAAFDLYYRVVTDDALADWVDPQTERANLTAYAMFRQMLTRLLMGDLGDAQVDYGILQNGYPAGSPGSAYAAMAAIFWETYAQAADLAAACASAQAYATDHAGEILDPLYYGYANPTYDAQDICPFGP